MRSVRPPRLTSRRISAVVVVASIGAAIAMVTPWPRVESNRQAPTASLETTPQRDTPATVEIAPPSGAVGVRPVGETSVTVSGGTLGVVSLVNDRGTAIPGTVAPDRRSWKPTVPLEYDTNYTLTASLAESNSFAAERVSHFTTVSPQSRARVSLRSTSGTALRDGATYGVGVVAVAKFDRPVTDRSAAERSLTVETQPHVEGSWFWLDDQTVHWRPALYYTPDTTVTVRAAIYGAHLGGGMYGAEDSSVTFRIGDSHISVADDRTKQIQVFENGALVRTMPTSMGKGGTQTIGGTTLAFWTQPGAYTVLDKSDTVLMDSSTYGLPLDVGYKLSVNYAVRLTHGGVYLHQLDSTVWAQGNTNVSHGCLNLNADNARWFYEFSQPGDVVEVRNTGGEPLSVWQNGDWSVPWETWREGSALS